MPRTIQCPQCGIILNVPDSALGKKLKCPKCATRFGTDGSAASKSTAPGVADARPASSQISNASLPGLGDLVLPQSEGDLRETFDLSMMTGEADGTGAGSGGKAADAVALFSDVPERPRKATKAEARMKPRRCPTCSGHVPAGMSLCSTCGLDLETGQRIDLVEDLEPVSAPRRSNSLPLGVAIVGGASFLGSLVLGLVALFKWQAGVQGAQLLAIVCGFGIYAAVQFLRGKSVKLLVVALSIGAMIDVLVLLALPIYSAQNKAAEPIGIGSYDPELTGVTRPVTEALDIQQIWWGIALLLAYAAVSLYLNSPPVRRHFERKLLP